SRLVKDHTFQRIELALPGGLIERAHGLSVAGLPTHADAGGTKIDVLGVVFVLELRRQQAHDVHGRVTTVSGEGLRLFASTDLFRQHPGEVANNTTHVMQLSLSRDVARDPARILNVLVTVEDLPDGFWLIAHRVPQVNRENQ